MAKEVTRRNITFLGVNKDGYLFSNSKEEKEGYERVELKNGNITYHKLFKSTEDGRLSNFDIEEKEFNDGVVKFLTFTISSTNGVDKVSVPLTYQNGNLSDYAKGVAVIAPNLDFSRTMNISPNKKKNDNGYLDRFLFFNYTDGSDPKYPARKHRYGSEGDIPMPKKETKMGKETWVYTEQDEYLYNILLNEIERFKEYRKAQGIEINNNNFTVSTPDTPQEEDITDDLPF